MHVREITHILPDRPPAAGSHPRTVVIDGIPYPEEVVASWIGQGRRFVIVHPETAFDADVVVERCPDTGRPTLGSSRLEVSLDDLPHWGGT